MKQYSIDALTEQAYASFPEATDKPVIGMTANHEGIDATIRDPANPVLVAEFPYPEVPEGFPYPNFNVMNLGCQGPFGPHNVHEPMSHKPLEQSNALVYNCYFAAGLRIFDVRDPYYIKEVAHFIPPNPGKKPEESFFRGFPGPRNAVTEDCCVDDRGYIFVTCLDDGFYVLRRTGRAAEINAVMEREIT